MSQIRPSTTPPSVNPGSPVTNLTLVVLLLIPCVVALLLLNCLFLGYKVLALSKKNRRRKDLAEELLLRSTLRRVGGGSGAAFRDVPPPPVTSSRASSRERTGADRGGRLLRPDCQTGSGSPTFPSTIRATSTAGGFNPRVERPRRARRVSGAGWGHSAPVLPRSSDSEADARVNLVPPNSPMQGSEGSGHAHRSGTYRLLPEGNAGVAVHVFDKVDMLCEYTDPPSEVSCTDTSAASGLDSDFGASAGVSLRILSADSDGLSNGVLASALEWDYYDPCYVKQNNVPKHKHHRPAVHIKQYWV